MNSDAIECLCLEISTKTSKNLILSLNYRPPNGDTTLFEKHMKSILSKNEATKKEVILIGDFSMNLLDFDKDKRVQSFVNLIFRFGMIPTINKPTRVTRHTATAIDHVFTNTIMGNIEIKTAIVKTDISDHFPIIFAAKNNKDTVITILNVISQTSHSINLSKNYAILIGTILRFYEMSMMRIVNFSKFFIPCK